MTCEREKLIRTSIQITRQQRDLLDELARRENPVDPSRATIIRRAIDRYLEDAAVAA